MQRRSVSVVPPGLPPFFLIQWLRATRLPLATLWPRLRRYLRAFGVPARLRRYLRAFGVPARLRRYLRASGASTPTAVSGSCAVVLRYNVGMDHS